VKHVLSAIFILLIITFSTGAPGAENADETSRMKNGRFWSALTDDERIFVTMGIHDGWELRGQTESATQGMVLRAFNRCASPVTNGEDAEMITLAYKEPENRVLPIGWVVMADEAIRCGETTGDVVFPALRKFLADTSGKDISYPGLSPIPVILSVSTKSH